MPSAARRPAAPPFDRSPRVFGPGGTGFGAYHRYVTRRRYVARGVPGGYRIWDNKRRCWWGDHYELCPDDLLTELNGRKAYDRITALLKRSRAAKR